MSKKISSILLFGIVVGFIAFLTFAASRVSLNFDASYNLLSYQNLFNKIGFSYTYNSITIPFDPTISTGPELYTPVFFIWKIIGSSDYLIASYVVVAYYLVFFAFIFLQVFKKNKNRLIFLITFLFFFFTNDQMFEGRHFIDPLGEVLSSLLVFAGFYYLYKKKLLVGFILLGLALDTKTNIIIALIPTLAVFLFFDYLWPLIKKKEYPAFFKTAAKLFLFSFIILIPYLTYSKIAPGIILNQEEKAVLEEKKIARIEHQKARGFGHFLAVAKNPGISGMKKFNEMFREKIITLNSFFNKNYFLLILFVISFIPFLILARGHFSFYLFTFSIFYIIWWLIGTADYWYRYFFIPEFIYGLAIASLMPKLLTSKTIRNKKNNLLFILTIILVAVVYIPQFSLETINRILDKGEREEMFLMSQEIQDLNEEQIFTYGWFQAPQLMVLNNKRFGDYLDPRRVERMKQKYGQVYLLTTIENTIIQDEMDEIEKNLALVKEYGYNKLYVIKKLPEIKDLE